MKIENVNIRDPYILLKDNKYYLYGTRSESCWGEAEGFDCYISDNLEDWEGPIEIFRRPEGFFANQNYWAPECYFYNGNYYLVTTFGANDRKKGIYILRSDSPTGPFHLYSDCLTPKEWNCIDGSLFIDQEFIYLIFSHSFEDTPDGDMCMIELTSDLKAAKNSPVKLFSAVEAPWAKPIPFAKKEFNMDGEVYFTDGPCVLRLEEGELCMVWSSWGTKGYAVGQAIAESGLITGPWKQLENPLFPENGGHGMAFQDKQGFWKYTLHFPNDKYKEHPIIQNIVFEKGYITFQ